MFHHRTIFVFIALITFCLAGCAPEEQTTSITVSFTPELKIPATHGVTYEVEAHSDVIYPNIQEELSNNQSDTSLITNVEPNNIQINLTEPSDANFDFADDLELFIEASGLPSKKIGGLTNVPTGQTTIQLDLVSDASDLESYLRKGSVAFTLKYTSDEYVGTDMVSTLLVAFKIDADTTNP